MSASCGAARKETATPSLITRLASSADSDGSKQQSDGAGVGAGVGGSGQPVPALVLRMATRREEKRG